MLDYTHIHVRRGNTEDYKDYPLGGISHSILLKDNLI